MILTWVKYTLAGVSAAAFLSACGGGQFSNVAPAGSGASQLTRQRPLGIRSTLAAVHTAGFAEHSDRGRSWISPASGSSDLLYISDAQKDDVYVYQYPGLTLSGTLTGFHEPQGECTDAKDDVWITDTNAQNVVEFAHGGTKAIAKLTDSSGYPVGCAVNTKTGDLAVTNIFGVSGAGAVLVYKDATGKPTAYTNKGQYYYYFDGYDPNGNLYVSGRNDSGFYTLAVLPSGASSMSTVSLSGGTIVFPGAVQWVGTSLVLGDQQCGDANASCLYEATISGTSGKITGATHFKGACDVIQPTVDGSAVAGGDFESCYYSSTGIHTWAYPAGGSPTKSVTAGEEPDGSAISNS